MRRRAGLPLILVLLIAPPTFADGSGSIRGTVRLRGVPPPPRLVDMRADPACPRVPVLDDEVVVGAGGGLANVYVAVDTLEVHPATAAPSPATSPVVGAAATSTTAAATSCPRISTASASMASCASRAWW